jgi:hypothetical protein
LGSPNTSQGTKFADQDKISEYGLDALNYLTQKDIISGYPDNTFAPFANMNRAETVAIIYKLISQ